MSTTKKVIALPISIGEEKASITTIYIDYIVNAGYTPLLVYPYDKDSIERACEISDGLLMSGGVDIDPTYYGYENKDSKRCDPERDQAHRDTLFAFADKGKPIFAICRGMQMVMLEYIKEVDVSCKFQQDIKDHNPAFDRDLKRGTTSHSVQFKGIEDKEYKKIFVNSMHHQGFTTHNLKKLKKQIDVIAYTDIGLLSGNEYIIEGIYLKNASGSRILGVQWHPEELKDYKLLQDFFK